MPEEQLYKVEQARSLAAIADTLRDAADQIEAGTVELRDGDAEAAVELPATPTFEVELERLTDSETGVETYELEYEVTWTVSGTSS